MRLITNEDPFHIHKIFGLYCILNFMLQIYLFFTEKMILSLWVLLPHILLPTTSLFFNVLNKRPKKGKMKMFIWKELQLHSILFSLRAIFTILFPEKRIYIIFCTMLFADFISKLYGTKGFSTVRGKQSKNGKRSILLELQAFFFSSSQLGATLICSGILQKQISPELIFLTLPPIQTSAFGMTLIRKNLINKRTWSILYSLELLLVYFGWYYLKKNMSIIPYTILIYILRRFVFKNKYLMWLNIFLFDKLKQNIL